MNTEKCHWRIWVGGGYGEFDFFGTEEEAEEMRAHKARREGAPARKARVDTCRTCGMTPLNCYCEEVRVAARVPLPAGAWSTLPPGAAASPHLVAAVKAARREGAQAQPYCWMIASTRPPFRCWPVFHEEEAAAYRDHPDSRHLVTPLYVAPPERAASHAQSSLADQLESRARRLRQWAHNEPNQRHATVLYENADLMTEAALRLRARARENES